MDKYVYTHVIYLFIYLFEEKNIIHNNYILFAAFELECMYVHVIQLYIIVLYL